MRTGIALLMTFLVLVAALLGAAYEFQPMGFQSIGMGGAGVACATGPFAGYYNPALLALAPRAFALDNSTGFGVRERNLADNLYKLTDVDQLDATLSNITANALTMSPMSTTDSQHIQDALTVLKSMSGGNNSLSAMPSEILGMRMGTFAIGFYGTFDTNASAVIDANHLDIIEPTAGGYVRYDPAGNSYAPTTLADYNAHSLQYALDNHLTYVQLNGFQLSEVPVSYAHLVKTAFGALSVGGSVKLMQGYSVNQQVDFQNYGDLVTQVKDQLKQSSNALGLDLGVALQPLGTQHLVLGLVAKDVNSPKFNAKTPVAYTVNPMYRLGVAQGVGNHLDLAVDYDLTKNPTLSGIKSQYLGGGLNFHPTSWLSLRVGAMKNQVKTDEGTILTAGFGIGPLSVALERSNNTSTAKVGSISVPRYTWLSASFASSF